MLFGLTVSMVMFCTFHQCAEGDVRRIGDECILFHCEAKLCGDGDYPGYAAFSGIQMVRELCSAEQTFTVAAECWTLSRYTLSQVLRAATIPDPGAWLTGMTAWCCLQMHGSMYVVAVCDTASMLQRALLLRSV